jgi:hypothetical protein
MGSPRFLWRSQILSEELVEVTTIEDPAFAIGLWGANGQTFPDYHTTKVLRRK